MTNRLVLNRTLINLLKTAFDAAEDASAWQINIVDAEGRDFEVIFRAEGDSDGDEG